MRVSKAQVAPLGGNAYRREVTVSRLKRLLSAIAMLASVVGGLSACAAYANAGIGEANVVVGQGTVTGFPAVSNPFGSDGGFVNTAGTVPVLSYSAGAAGCNFNVVGCVLNQTAFNGTASGGDDSSPADGRLVGGFVLAVCAFGVVAMSLTARRVICRRFTGGGMFVGRSSSGRAGPVTRIGTLIGSLLSIPSASFTTGLAGVVQ